MKKREKRESYGVASRVYEKSWPLARSPALRPGENYSRYEFTVGAGL